MEARKSVTGISGAMRESFANGLFQTNEPRRIALGLRDTRLPQAGQILLPRLALKRPVWLSDVARTEAMFGADRAVGLP